MGLKEQTNYGHYAEGYLDGYRALLDAAEYGRRVKRMKWGFIMRELKKYCDGPLARWAGFSKRSKAHDEPPLEWEW